MMMKKGLRLPFAVLLAFMLVATACGSDGSDSVSSTSAADPAGEVESEPAAEVEATEAPSPAAEPEAAEPEEPEPAESPAESSTNTGALSCEDTAALFTTKGSVNPQLVDPESSAVCDGDTITITANGIPDYTYIGTSPGDPRAQNLSVTIPATPTATTDFTDVPLIGPMALALNGVPIYGPTEGTGGDVLSLGGGLSECGSHNGPTGFHMHLFGTSTTTDCIYTPEEAAAAPQLLGYAFDGYPIYTGNTQYSSSWSLTDDTLFASDTWAAHSYVAGSGDLDQCNGLTDANGNYAYYTTDTFPYVMGCFAGEVELAGRGGGEGPGGEGPGGDRDADESEGPGVEGDEGPGGQDAAGPGGGGGGGVDLANAAAALGITVEELQVALGTSRPPDFDAAAATLGITVEELEAVLPARARP